MNLKRILLLQTVLIGILILLVARLYWHYPEKSKSEQNTTEISIPEQSDSLIQEPIHPEIKQAITPRIPEKTTELKAPQKEKKTNPTVTIRNEEEKKYYSNGKLSVWISLWKDGRRTWTLYDLYGNITIELEEVRLSYTVSYDARFYENGAVRVIHFSENPGAANFWYEGEMEFGTTNEPITRRVRKMPYESLEEMSSRAWQYWDKRSGSWKEQEVMEGVPD